MTAHDEDERTADRRSSASMNDGQTPEGSQTAAAGDTATTLADALEKADNYYRNWQRAAADFANYKKRVEQERAENARLIKAALIINLLPIYDDMDRATGTLDTDLESLNWVQGILAIQQKFARLLEALDVREIPAAGEPFDPQVHEAVARQPGEEGKILHVAQKGYLLSDKVIRPAMVIVGDGTPGG
ncbi:MAG: nucleotide exchange factor GrpE [Dehalococcoidia bacterium]|nr:nucleotide exchange factor GrpE [Dehalococcoidia bacterium]